jgi:hypothetical protein
MADFLPLGIRMIIVPTSLSGAVILPLICVIEAPVRNRSPETHILGGHMAPQPESMGRDPRPLIEQACHHQLLRRRSVLSTKAFLFLLWEGDHGVTFKQALRDLPPISARGRMLGIQAGIIPFPAILEVLVSGGVEGGC